MRRAMVVCLVLGAACGRLSFDPLGHTDADAVADTTVLADGSAASYHELGDTTKWSTFDLSFLGADARGFAGGAFNGRYLYLVPYLGSTYDGLVVRYDTQGPFADTLSWTSFDLTTLDTKAAGFAGAVVAGHYVYFFPNYNGSPASRIARLDTQMPFAAAAWTLLDTANVSPLLAGFQGAAFDGQFIYTCPWNNGSYDGYVARYDTTAAFQFNNVTYFDATTVDAAATGYFGSTFDHRYVYFTPYYNGTTFDGLVLRYDTTMPFQTAGAWATVDLSLSNANAVGYNGGVFGGHYVYLVPGTNGTVARLDTAGAFATSWDTFDTSTLDATAKGFVGGAFDGRNLYLVPYGPGSSGLVVRYNGTGSFTSANAWTKFDVTTIDGAAHGFHFAAFDGEYIYLLPHATSTIARFDAKSPASLYDGYTGSFF